MNAFIRLLYAVLIAVSVAIFVGMAIYSFYPGPKAPDYTSYSSSNYHTTYTNYRADEKDYEKKVTYIVLPAAALSLAAGLQVMRRSEVIGEGLALGGVATSIYGIITASIADSRPLRFVAVTFLLAGVLLLAGIRFASPKRSKKA